MRGTIQKLFGFIQTIAKKIIIRGGTGNFFKKRGMNISQNEVTNELMAFIIQNALSFNDFNKRKHIITGDEVWFIPLC